jgi:hypothetical protein
VKNHTGGKEYSGGRKDTKEHFRLCRIVEWLWMGTVCETEEKNQTDGGRRETRKSKK